MKQCLSGQETLFLHPDKCFPMNVRSKSKRQCNHIYSMKNKTLKVKSELKDSGVLTDENLNFIQLIELYPTH